MAGEASSSSSTSRSIYDVFLSFRGKDTRTHFTDHLYKYLLRAGIHTFRDDDEIERGENIQLELEKAIKESKISIIVFSKDYASSKWCLDELVMIIQRTRTSQHVVLPVFYHVPPSEVRNQSGGFAEAFARYAEANEWMEKVQGWRKALREVADLAGMELKDGYESNFMEDIVKRVENELYRTVSRVTPHLIGIDSQVRKINQWLQEGSTNVSIVAIWGMGGIGKTTMARCIYELNSRGYGGSSFLENIRGILKRNKGLIRFQKQLLSDILGRKPEIRNVDDGMSKIKRATRDKMVFIVLDDVDTLDELNKILEMLGCLGGGSKIIITTRHKRLLNANEVYKVHEVNKLDDNESLELFSRHAFKKDHPIDEAYKQHSKSVVGYCGGLPLALKVLGGSLSGKSEEVWESAIKKLKAIPNKDISEVLEISYDPLEANDQKLFLHIACFFVGEKKDFTVKILVECGFFPIDGIQNLIDRCLLTIDGDNKLMVHHLLREMGENIICKASKEKLGKHSRLWRHEDSFQVLKQKIGTKKIEGLILDMRMIEEDKKNGVNLETDAFTEMQELKILQLYHVQLTGCYEKFPKSLRWLCWHGFPFKKFPSDFPLKSMVVLDLGYSSFEQVWEGTKCIGQLKILNLSHCRNLAKTPDFSGQPNINLETLILNDCARLVEFHESIGNLEGLVFLNLKNCKNLRKLPKTIGMLKSLETLIISGCSNLSEFPGEFKKMESLKVLHADGIAINRSLSTTRELNLKPRRSPEFFSWASLPSSLVRLSLGDCNLSDHAFPRDLSNLSLLQFLNLSNNPIYSLPDCIKGLSSLEFLDLESCRSLRSLLGLPDVIALGLADCTSLEKIIYQSTLFRLVTIVDGFNCDKLVEIEGFFKLEPISEVDAEMINYMGLGLFNLESMGDIQVEYRLINRYSCTKLPIQGLHEFGIFSTFVPGREVPSGWFSDEKGSGSSISFTVPSRHNLRIRGLNVYFVYALQNRYYCCHALYTKISNKTKNLNWIYSPTCHGIPEDNEDMVWLSHWPFGNQLEVGDQVHVSIIVGDEDFQVKECGINFVYDDDDEEEEEEEKKSKPHNNTKISCEQVIGGDLSRYHVDSTGAYFLCHRDNGSNDYADPNDNDDSDYHGDPDIVTRTRRAWHESMDSIDGARTFKDFLRENKWGLVFL